MAPPEMLDEAFALEAQSGARCGTVAENHEHVAAQVGDAEAALGKSWYGLADGALQHLELADTVEQGLERTGLLPQPAMQKRGFRAITGMIRRVAIHGRHPS